MSARHVLIVGASRGIGLEFVRQYVADGARVFGTARSDEGLEAVRDAGGRPLRLDVAQLASTSGIAWQLDGEAFDTVVISAGVHGPRTTGLEPPVAQAFDEVMHTNVLGPMRVIAQIVDAVAPGGRLAVLSSLKGSIGSRSNASDWLYRASKAALNSVLKDTALALAGRAVCVAFHPGWVRTDMGGPNGTLAADDSVQSMRHVLTGLGAHDNGRFLDHDGTPIPW